MFSMQHVEQIGVESGDKYGFFYYNSFVGHSVERRGALTQPAAPAEPAQPTDTGARNL